MNGVYVNGTKLRKERDYTTPEYREAVVRDYVKANPGKVIQIADFTRILDGYTGTSRFIVSLIAKGKLIRHKAGRGKAYGYKWHTEVTTKPPVHGAVITTKVHYATELQLKKLDDWFHDYCNSEDSVDGANRFRKFIHNKAKEEA